MHTPLIKPFLLILLICGSYCSDAQNIWNRKKCAVSLTYDDALNVHLDNVIPALDSLGLRATFYITAYAPGCKDRMEAWKSAASRGHELGNHMLFHPCIGSGKGREWVSVERDLNRYTMDRFLDEVRMMNVFLKSMDGLSQRTFAYTCGDTLVQGQSVVPKVMSEFVCARGVKGEMVSFEQKNLYNLGSYMVNGQSSAELIDLVKQAMRTNSAIVFLFHGVGGEHGLNVGLKEHRELLRFLKANENQIWIAPLVEIGSYIKDHHKGANWR